MTRRKVSGAAQGDLKDDTERWLRENDPEYLERSREWIAPTTDLLTRILQDEEPKRVDGFSVERYNDGE